MPDPNASASTVDPDPALVPYVAHASAWGVRWSGQSLADLEQLASKHGGSRPAAVLAAIRDLVRWVDASVSGAPMCWLDGSARAIHGPDPLRPGWVRELSTGEQTRVQPYPSPDDRQRLARIEVLLSHVNGERPSLASLLRTVVGRGAELERSRCSGLHAVTPQA